MFYQNGKWQVLVLSFLLLGGSSLFLGCGERSKETSKETYKESKPDVEERKIEKATTKSEPKEKPKGVIVLDGSKGDIRNGPGTEYEAIAQAKEGQVIAFFRREGPWLRIGFGEKWKNKGWMFIELFSLKNLYELGLCDKHEYAAKLALEGDPLIYVTLGRNFPKEYVKTIEPKVGGGERVVYSIYNGASWIAVDYEFGTVYSVVVKLGISGKAGFRVDVSNGAVERTF